MIAFLQRDVTTLRSQGLLQEAGEAKNEVQLGQNALDRTTADWNVAEASDTEKQKTVVPLSDQITALEKAVKGTARKALAPTLVCLSPSVPFASD